MRATNVNPLATMLCLMRLVVTVLFFAGLAQHFAWPPFEKMSDATVWRSVTAIIVGSIAGGMVEEYVWRRIDIFGQKQ